MAFCITSNLSAGTNSVTRFLSRLWNVNKVRTTHHQHSPFQPMAYLFYLLILSVWYELEQKFRNFTESIITLCGNCKWKSRTYSWTPPPNTAYCHYSQLSSFTSWLHLPLWSCYFVICQHILFHCSGVIFLRLMFYLKIEGFRKI